MADANERARNVELEPGDAWAHIYLGSYLWGNEVDSAVKAFHAAGIEVIGIDREVVEAPVGAQTRLQLCSSVRHVPRVSLQHQEM